jgi:hypothetical protein
MEFDFKPDSQSLIIPQSAYRPIIRCSYCHSVYLNDTHCDSCGRKIGFEALGKPFSVKSFYILKEKYIRTAPLLVKLFPIFENKTLETTKSYKRNLVKRFKDLLLGFSNPNQLSNEDRTFFYLEMKDLIDELMVYEVASSFLIGLVHEYDNESLLLQDLDQYIYDKALKNRIDPEWTTLFGEYKIAGVLRVKFISLFFLIMTAIVFAAIKFYPLFLH